MKSAVSINFLLCFYIFNKLFSIRAIMNAHAPSAYFSCQVKYCGKTNWMGMLIKVHILLITQVIPRPLFQQTTGSCILLNFAQGTRASNLGLERIFDLFETWIRIFLIDSFRFLRGSIHSEKMSFSKKDSSTRCFQIFFQYSNLSCFYFKQGSNKILKLTLVNLFNR